MLDEIFFLGAGTLDATPAPLLAAVGVDRLPFDITGMGNCDYDVLFGNQVLIGEVLHLLNNLRATFVAEFAFHFQ